MGERGQGFGISPGADDRRCAENFCDLYREFSSDTGCSQDKHGLTARKLGAMAEGKPCRDAGIRNSGSGGVVKILRNRKTLRAADDGAFRERAVGPARSAE